MHAHTESSPDVWIPTSQCDRLGGLYQTFLLTNMGQEGQVWQMSFRGSSSILWRSHFQIPLLCTSAKSVSSLYPSPNEAPS